METKKQQNKRLDRSIVHGAVGGLLGACVGLPGLGIAVGVANANKDKIKKYAKKLDESN